VLALAMMLTSCCAVQAQPSVAVIAVRLDNDFRLTGSDSSGLIVSVSITELKPHTTSDDFRVRLFDDKGQPSGVLTCFAMKSLDAADPRPRWMLLDGPTGTLGRAYAALLQSNAAILHKGRTRIIDKAGRYEFVYLIGPNVREAALISGASRPEASRIPAIPLKIPWP
jgi:hypothetical protein